MNSIARLVDSLSLVGKLVFFTLFALFVGSGLTAIYLVNSATLIEVPQPGGTLVEGVIGLPRFINPVLAVTDGDRDITALVYSGLMQHQTDGTLAPDLAETYSISPDGRSYTFALKQGVAFQDGTPITVDDIIFTIQKIQDPATKSTEFANWTGVILEKHDDRHITFRLNEPYAPFLENTTIGILPRHKWSGTDSNNFHDSPLNTEPIGSGPYVVDSIRKNNNGTPTAYVLKPFKKHVAGAPYLKKIVIAFYANEEDLINAYNAGAIDSLNGISPIAASALEQNGATIALAPLPRAFGVYFNTNNNIALAERSVRQALNVTANRSRIVRDVLHGYGEPLSGPAPSAFVDDTTSEASRLANPNEYGTLIAQANELLDKSGWKLNADNIREKKISGATTTLAFSISTSEASELRQAAAILREEWRKIGADVTIKVFEGGNLNQSVIQPRQYEALLFGQVVNRDLDLYAFWHSTQRNDPGLNIALYENKTADELLEKIRASIDPLARQADYRKLETEIAEDVPAVFLYSPHFIYVVPRHVRNIALSPITTPSDRFANIAGWYIHTDKVWKVFANNK